MTHLVPLPPRFSLVPNPSTGRGARADARQTRALGQSLIETRPVLPARSCRGAAQLAVLLVLATFVTTGCAAARSASQPPAPPSVSSPLSERPDDDDLREAVFRHLFEHNASGMQANARVYCLEIEGQQDPSPRLLARFDGNAPPVKKASLCHFERGHEKRGVVDDTGATGLLFRVTSIRRTGPDTAVLEGGYFEAGLSASGNVFELAREQGRWVVKSDVMKWIS